MRARTLIFILASSGLSASAKAGPCRDVPVRWGLDDSFFSKKWSCESAEIDEMWGRFDFDRPDWDDGFGFHDRCYDGTALKRTFNALQLLKYAAGYWNCNEKDPNFLAWAYCWTGKNTDELDARCANGDYVAMNKKSWWDHRTELYARFFFKTTVVNRAAILVHEARHDEQGCYHESCPSGRGECDSDYFNGCGRGRMGTYAMQVHWLAHYIWRSVPHWRDKPRVDNAIASANAILGSRFSKDPCFRLAPGTGQVYTTCR